MYMLVFQYKCHFCSVSVCKIINYFHYVIDLSIVLKLDDKLFFSFSRDQQTKQKKMSQKTHLAAVFDRTIIVYLILLLFNLHVLTI